MRKIIALASGGMDSTVLAYLLKEEGWDVNLLSFNYGQRHKKETAFAARTAEHLDVRFDLIDLSSVGRLFVGSSLTDTNVPVPEGHYASAAMKLTVVPNRNSIMANIAAGIAISRGADAIALAVHAGDHAIYADCRPAFIGALQDLLRVSTESEFTVIAPFLYWYKYQIVTLGATLGVPFSKTWSCYKGGDLHCGKCGTCVERIEAFEQAGLEDPTDYES